MHKLSTKISLCQSGIEEETLALIEKFKPLLLSYAKKLKSEDAYEDLLCAFIELVSKKINLEKLNCSNDYTLLSYIKKSVHNEYIKLSIREQRYKTSVSFNDLNEADPEHIQNVLCQYEEKGFLLTDLKSLRTCLTKREFDILELHFINGYKFSEIAKLLGVSKAAISQSKKNIVKKIQLFFK